MNSETLGQAGNYDKEGDGIGNQSSSELALFPALPPDKCKALLVHYAAASPTTTIDVIEALVASSPTSLRCKDANGRVPMHWAAMHSHSVEMLQYLLSQWPGATRIQDKNDYTPLQRLLTRLTFPEQAAMIACLVEADPFTCNLVTKDGNSCLHLYCHCYCWFFESDYDLQCEATYTKIFTAHPAAVSRKNNTGDLPVHILCSNLNSVTGNALLLLELLLSAYKEGSSVRNNAGYLPVHCALRRDATMPVAVLARLLGEYPEELYGQEAKNIEQGFLRLAVNKEVQYDPDRPVEMVRYLINRSPGLARTVTQIFGWLPLLHFVVARGSFEMVKILYVAYPDARKQFTTAGSLPLHLAVRKYRGNPLSAEADIVRFLLRQYPEAVNMRQREEFPAAAEMVAVAAVADGAEGGQQQGGEGAGVAGGGDMQQDGEEEEEEEEEEEDDDDSSNRTPYQVAVRQQKDEYLQRLLLIACPAADPQRLRDLNYEARRPLMFIAFAARTEMQSTSSSSVVDTIIAGVSESSSSSSAGAEWPPQHENKKGDHGDGRTTSSDTTGTGNGTRNAVDGFFVYQLRSLAHIGGEERGLLRLVASFL